MEISLFEKGKVQQLDLMLSGSLTGNITYKLKSAKDKIPVVITETLQVRSLLFLQRAYPLAAQGSGQRGLPSHVTVSPTMYLCWYVLTFLSICFTFWIYISHQILGLCFLLFHCPSTSAPPPALPPFYYFSPFLFLCSLFFLITLLLFTSHFFPFCIHYPFPPFLPPPSLSSSSSFSLPSPPPRWVFWSRDDQALHWNKNSCIIWSSEFIVILDPGPEFQTQIVD